MPGEVDFPAAEAIGLALAGDLGAALAQRRAHGRQDSRVLHGWEIVARAYVEP